MGQGLPPLLGHGLTLDSELLTEQAALVADWYCVITRDRRSSARARRALARCIAEEHTVEEDNDNGGT